MTALLTPDAMSALEKRAFASGIVPFSLMEQAGHAVADAARAMQSPGARVLALCGPGNNGGDAYIAASALKAAGFAITCFAPHDPAHLKGDAARAFALWDGPLTRALPDLSTFALVIDGLYGGGLSRDLTGIDAQLIAAINASAVPVLAIDLPSGVDGATGKVRGVALQAKRTVTFEALRVGHALLPGRVLSGEVSVAPLGLEAFYGVHMTFLNAPALFIEALRFPDAMSHKYTRGHAAIISGPLPMTGAARLSALSAARIGAGAVTVLSPPDAVAIHCARLDAVMVKPFVSGAEVSAFAGARKVAALALGPGLGDNALSKEALEAALSIPLPLVLDADAITAFAGDAAGLGRALRHPQRKDAAALITPHEGEFKTLFKGDDAILHATSKLEAARLAAQKLGCTVIYKGGDTVVASPDGRASIAINASPVMATAGSGDLLTGIACGLLAQGVAAFEAASAAVWLHGEIGRHAGIGFIADDGPVILPLVLQLLCRGRRDDLEPA